ncbi:MAG: DEAD/DEAH box helicase [Candidatus Micrarchaeota archaeon]
MLTVSEELLKLGYSSLNKMQEKLVAEGFLSSNRCLVSAPTASGKTLLALLKIVQNYAETKTKAVYVVPLRALASEKHREFTEKLALFGMSVALSTGDLDDSSEVLSQYDVVIVTSEKLDSLLRHEASWLESVGLLVVDEVHLLNDSSRGATLEIVLTKMLSAPRLLCLSATVPNSIELSQWLSAKLFESDYRPTVLHKGVCDGESLELIGKREKLSEFEKDLVFKALSENEGKGQALFFVSSRKKAESLARSIGEFTVSLRNDLEKNDCNALSNKALKVFSTPTAQCKDLSYCLEKGVAFHHAGLPSKQRAIVEDGFKKARCIKVIVATTTLAMGLDLPASWVVVRDLKRFNGAFSEFIPNFEAQQMLGRAGRPNYDTKGIGVLCCSPKDRKKVFEKYVFGDVESVFSKLSSQAVLRSHVLALVASGFVKDFKSLYSFFESTFFAFQYKQLDELFSLIEEIVFELKEMDFLREKSGLLVATPVGKRVSELYIDPLTAWGFVDFCSTAPTIIQDFDYLVALTHATESRPLVSCSASLEKKLWEELYSLNDYSFTKLEQDSDSLKKFVTAKVLNAWVNEENEASILEEFGLPPGVVQARVRNSEWLAYCLAELAFLLNKTSVYASAKKMRRRIKHGIKEELLDVCRIKGVGRVRGRKLFTARVKSSEDYKLLSKDEIKQILK